MSDNSPCLSLFDKKDEPVKKPTKSVNPPQKKPAQKNNKTNNNKKSPKKDSPNKNTKAKENKQVNKQVEKQVDTPKKENLKIENKEINPKKEEPKDQPSPIKDVSTEDITPKNQIDTPPNKKEKCNKKKFKFILEKKKKNIFF